MTELQTYNISLDTSFIEGQNFLHGSSINELGRLSGNETVNLFITDITYREIISRFNKNLLTAEEKIKKPKREFESNARILRNFEEFNSAFELPEIDINKLLNQFREKFDKWISDSLIKTIPTGTITIKEVFDDYFNENPPFHSSQKKHEFPDAFTAKALSNYFSDSKTYLLCHDKDLLELENGRIIPINNAAKLIDLIIRESSKKTNEAIVELIDECFRNEILTVENNICNLIEAYIKDEIGGMIDYDNVIVQSTNYVEITELSIYGYSIVHLDPQVSKIKTDIKFSFVASFSGIDRRDGWYDPLTQLWNYANERDYIIEDTYDTTALIQGKVSVENEIVEFEIENINEEKDFKIFESFRSY